MRYYFDEKIKYEDFDFDNILVDEKSHKNILIYDVSYETLFQSKPLLIRFDKIRWLGTRSSRSNKWYHIYYFSLLRENQS